MKLSSALLLLTSAVLGVRPSSAQGEPKYFEVGTTLTLEPGVSTVPQPINSIRWKYGTALVVDWDPSGHTYYGSFRGRTTLDPQTLRLVIDSLTLADSRQFSVETNLGTVGTHEVKVIKPPPKPLVNTTKNSEGAPALKCTADTKDLGPVTYEWKIDKCKTDQCMKEELEEGPWTKGEELKGMKSSDTPEKFSCRLKTRVRTSNASDPVLNPTEPPPKPLVLITKISEGAHALNCTADTQDLGPVTYEWKEYKFMISEWKEGNWTKGDQLMVMSPKTCDKFSCRLITPLRPSEASDPVLNPLCEPVPIPKPRVMTTENSAGVYTLKCTADTQGLGPVSYEWKEYGRKEGNWTKGDQLMVMTSKTCEEFSCRLITLLRTSEASDPVLCEPGSIWWKVLLGITVPLVACAALITVVYKSFHKKPVRPADPVLVSLTASVKTAIQVEPANTLQQANGVAASNGEIEGQPNAAADPLLTSKSDAGDSESGK